MARVLQCFCNIFKNSYYCIKYLDNCTKTNKSLDNLTKHCVNSRKHEWPSLTIGQLYIVEIKVGQLVIHCPITGQLDIHCPTIGQLDIHCPNIGKLEIHCPIIGQLDTQCPTIRQADNNHRVGEKLFNNWIGVCQTSEQLEIHWLSIRLLEKKSRILETEHLLIDANSITDSKKSC